MSSTRRFFLAAVLAGTATLALPVYAGAEEPACIPLDGSVAIEWVPVPGDSQTAVRTAYAAVRPGKG